MLQVLAQTPLHAKHDRFCLHQVARNARRNEISFYLPLKDVSASQLQATFARYGDFSQNRKMTEQMGRLKFAPAKGFIKGFIDVVFSHNGRTYLVDWKSNYLGSLYEDYSMGCLGRAMTESYYFLQYHLYIVALDQLLRRRIDNYDYGRHFGGVFYIFLRGLNPDGDAATGIYYDLPDAQLVSALSRALIADR
jgi:exodeoxyribonuclease V beta subunit